MDLKWENNPNKPRKKNQRIWHTAARCAPVVTNARYRRNLVVGPPPLRGSFFLENGALCDTREKKIFPIGSKNVTPKKSDTKNSSHAYDSYF